MGIEINEEQISKIINTLKPNKLKGPDRMHPRILKETSQCITSPLEKIFRKSLDKGILPDDWKTANVTAIPKNVQYHPISLTSEAGEAMEKLNRDKLVVNFPFLDGDVPRSTSYGVYISELIRFARASSIVADFNTRNKLLTQKLLKQGYRYHKLRKTFSKFYRRYYDLISKFQVGLQSHLCQGLSEPDFYGHLVYKLKKIVGSNNFSAQFIKIISHYKKIGYNF